MANLRKIAEAFTRGYDKTYEGQCQNCGEYDHNLADTGGHILICEKCFIHGEIDGYRTDYGSNVLDLDHLAKNGVTRSDLARIAQVGDQVVKDGQVYGEVSQVCPDDDLVEFATTVYGVYVVVGGAVDKDERYDTIEEATSVYEEELDGLNQDLANDHIEGFAIYMDEVTMVGQISPYGEDLGLEWYPDESREEIRHHERGVN